MTIEEFATHIRKVASSEWELTVSIRDIEYIDIREELRIVFGHFEEKGVVYELLIDDVFSFFKIDEPVRKGSDIEPEISLKFPFVNMYRDSKVLNFLKKQLLINEAYPMPEKYLHYQLVAQNMIFNIVSRGKPPVINIIEEE